MSNFPASQRVGGSGLATIFVLIGIAIYFIPSIVAFNRHVEPRVAILLLNIFFGWTFLVWVAMLIWAYQARQAY